jgi:hypothetical protein
MWSARADFRTRTKGANDMTKQKPSTPQEAPKDLEPKSAINMTATGISLTARQEAERAEKTPKQPKAAKKASTRKSPRQKAAEAAAQAPKQTMPEWPLDATAATTAPDKASTAPIPPSCVTSPLPLACLADLFLGDLEQAGKSRGTVFGYSIDLALAIKYFGGKEAPATVLTTESITEFFESDAVTKTRTGKPKAAPTIDKTRRVLRQVLAWGEEKGYLPHIEVPAQFMPRRGAKAE